jgi:fumarylacetoacetase
VPLGPFLGKSFATSISAWVVPMDALAEARVPVPGQDPEPLDYLRGRSAPAGIDLHLEVLVNGTVVSRPRFRDMYWSPEQMLAHLTVNGASLRSGDLFGSGTVSGAAQDELGSLLELTWNATRPITLDDGAERGFLEDGDVVTLRGWAPGPRGTRVTLGEVSGRVLPSP